MSKRDRETKPERKRETKPAPRPEAKPARRPETKPAPRPERKSITELNDVEVGLGALELGLGHRRHRIRYAALRRRTA